MPIWVDCGLHTDLWQLGDRWLRKDAQSSRDINGGDYLLTRNQSASNSDVKYGQYLYRIVVGRVPTRREQRTRARAGTGSDDWTHANVAKIDFND